MEGAGIVDAELVRSGVGAGQLTQPRRVYVVVRAIDTVQGAFTHGLEYGVLEPETRYRLGGAIVIGVGGPYGTVVAISEMGTRSRVPGG